MIKNITIGQYFPGETLVHRMDPRIKIMSVFIFIISLFFVNRFIAYAPSAILLLAVIAISRIPFKYILKGLKPISVLIAITFFINVFMTKGEVLYRLGPLTATREGLVQAGFMAIRLVLLVVGTTLLTLTTSPIALTDGIEKLLNPFKRIGVPAHELAMMMTIALRFIPTLLEEADKIMKAQMARGADFESGNVVRRAKNLIPLLVPLFISAFRRADELSMAMESRCYRGGENRTRMRELVLVKTDYIAFAFAVVYFILIIAMRYFI
ncbi:energy-coupling factor transporter transmembrane protein EcfT [Andreesenia angusta]|uniref:Energy-coupling factor transporter transmembrane protein EcfT n=1 Tax=Andreesenia angusta TaxID=39480 RepID=A0A1S1V788_9FIRM|nr:energy-coupling factor transporter transmembrane component T [Andreesenia angusta]OHW62453.1 energy-coupling factor transporter transmembrane protein EcfT [Andreesenia angusta]